MPHLSPLDPVDCLTDAPLHADDTHFSCVDLRLYPVVPFPSYSAFLYLQEEYMHGHLRGLITRHIAHHCAHQQDLSFYSGVLPFRIRRILLKFTMGHAQAWCAAKAEEASHLVHVLFRALQDCVDRTVPPVPGRAIGAAIADAIIQNDRHQLFSQIGGLAFFQANFVQACPRPAPLSACRPERTGLTFTPAYDHHFKAPALQGSGHARPTAAYYALRGFRFQPVVPYASYAEFTGLRQAFMHSDVWNILTPRAAGHPDSVTEIQRLLLPLLLRMTKGVCAEWCAVIAVEMEDAVRTLRNAALLFLGSVQGPVPNLLVDSLQWSCTDWQPPPNCNLVPFFDDDFIDANFRRVQAGILIRRVSIAECHAMELAVAMGLHPRLGGTSLFSAVDKDIVMTHILDKLYC